MLTYGDPSRHAVFSLSLSLPPYLSLAALSQQAIATCTEVVSCMGNRWCQEGETIETLAQIPGRGERRISSSIKRTGISVDEGDDQLITFSPFSSASPFHLLSLYFQKVSI